MSSNTTIRDHLSEPIRVEDPDVAGPLAVFPLFGPEPSEQYVSLAKGRGLGVRVGEDDRGASVRDIVVQNRAEVSVLLYEGEEVLGAQQNRTFDVSVLVPAKAQLRVPVSCVEAGRWDGYRNREDFTPAPQAAYPRAAAAEERAGPRGRDGRRGGARDAVRGVGGRLPQEPSRTACHRPRGRCTTSTRRTAGAWRS